VYWLNCLRIFALSALTLSAQTHRVFLCGATSKGYVVGAKLPPSGLFTLTDQGSWDHLGYNHPFLSSLDYDRRNPRILYLAAGNGCIRSNDSGRTWRILTSWNVTELQDVTVDPHHPGTLFIALPDGIAASTDDGRTWRHTDSGISRKFTKTIRVDRAVEGRLLAGTELGIFLSTDNAAHWHRAAGSPEMITSLEQSPHQTAEWLAATQSSGLYRSLDNGSSWQPVPAIAAGPTLYKIAYDPRQPRRLAVCGWGPGVLVSDDNGRTFTPRNTGLPSNQIWSVAFDPDHSGRLYASVHEEAVFVSEDAGLHWARSGLEGSIIQGFFFVPEARP
jgi:photosystem II stability/assembly factor-like uncharacterized protein